MQVDWGEGEEPLLRPSATAPVRSATALVSATEQAARLQVPAPLLSSWRWHQEAPWPYRRRPPVEVEAEAEAEAEVEVEVEVEAEAEVDAASVTIDTPSSARECSVTPRKSVLTW